MVIGRIALKKARKRWKYDKDTKETLKRGKAKVIKGGKQGKRDKKYRFRKPTDEEKATVKLSKSGNVIKVKTYRQGENKTKKKLPSLSEHQEGADKAVKDKQRLRGEIGPPPPKGKNNPKLNLQIRTKLKELEAKDKRTKLKEKKKTTKPKNGKKK